MNSLKSALKLLAKGEFICPVRFEREYEALDTPEGRQRAQEWLETIGYRLARLHDEGAFFMAYNESPTTETRTRIREELKTVRNRLMPFVGFFNLLREAQGSDPQLRAGDVVWLTNISEAVRNSSALERRITDMRDLFDGRANGSNATVFRVQKMFKILEDHGYLKQTNEVSKGYTFTGKVDYLNQLIAFITVNVLHVSDEQVVDQIDPQARLDEGGEASTEVGAA